MNSKVLVWYLKKRYSSSMVNEIVMDGDTSEVLTMFVLVVNHYSLVWYEIDNHCNELK
jgi:hypothetical protein